MAKLTRLTLANIPFDLHITICIFLRPIDILALRKVCHQSIPVFFLLVAQVAGEHIKKTCKAFELATRQRAVWLAAFRRMCFDNTLFQPSFPIPNMSNLELEQAVTAPHRWIELCGTFKEQHPDDPRAILCPRTTRSIRNVAKSYLFLVPGGRYLVVAGSEGLSVWDLGYVSNACCKLIATGGDGLKNGSYYESFCMVQVTPDDMGLIILMFNRSVRVCTSLVYLLTVTLIVLQQLPLCF